MKFYCCKSKIAPAKEAFNKTRELLTKGKGVLCTRTKVHGFRMLTPDRSSKLRGWHAPCKTNS